MKAPKLAGLLGAFLFSTAVVWATSNHDYGADEYDAVIRGISPDGKYAITTHGDSDLGYDHFHVYLTNAITGKKIGPLEEVADNLDTGANAFAAKWSTDSRSVYIVCRISRHEAIQAMAYRIAHNRAFPLTKKHVNADADQSTYWQENGSGLGPSPQIFGTPKPKKSESDQ